MTLKAPHLCWNLGTVSPENSQSSQYLVKLKSLFQTYQESKKKKSQSHEIVGDKATEIKVWLSFL